MTPDRLEEIEAIDALDQCDGCRQDMCCDACDEARVHRSDLLVEVKRLREVLGWMNRRGGLGHDVHNRIRAALGEEPTP